MDDSETVESGLTPMSLLGILCVPHKQKSKRQGNPT